jgi:putative FmdB family regulatory protein
VPIYEYRCRRCELRTEHLRALADRDRAVPCPSCTHPAERVPSLSSFKLAGGGWFADGYTKRPT